MNKYTENQCQWVKENAHKYSRRELTKVFNELFQTNVTDVAIKCKVHKLGLHFKQREDFYTEEQTAWLKNNAGKYEREELAKLFNEKFQEQRTVNAIKTFCVRNNYFAPSDGRYKKGNKPWTTGKSKEEIQSHYTKESYQKMCSNLSHRQYRKIGDTVINKVNGIEYPYVVVEPPNGKQGYYWERCVPKSRYVWEQHYGKVPDDCIVICLDGNQMNTEIENLALVKNKEKIIMTSNDWWRLPKELKEVALTFCKLESERGKNE